MHKIQLRLSTLFLYLTFPCSPLLVRYDAASAQQVFRTRRCRILQSVPETVSSWQVKMNAFEMFLERCKQPEVRRCQIRAVGRVWNNRKSNALYRRWSSGSNVGSGVIVLKMYFFFLGKREWFVLSALLGSSRKSQRWFLSIFLNKFVKVLPVKNVSCADSPSIPRLVVQVHISATVPRFCYSTTYSTYVHSYLHNGKPIIASEFL
jgi:hypothetical protein